MTGATQVYGTNADLYSATVYNLGFTFYFMSVPYTSFSVNPDGQLRLGSTAITNHGISATSNVAYIAPFNSNNKTGPTGAVQYKVIGNSPNSVLVVEWKNLLIPSNGTSTNYSTFQLRLYENGGAIDFVYGNMNNSSTSSMSSSIGFSSSNTAATVGQVVSLTTTPGYNFSLTSYSNSSFAAVIIFH
jgi:hypothetical protein